MRPICASAVLALALVLIAAAAPIADSLRANPQAAALFAQALTARDAAQAVDAYLYAPAQWQRAENVLAGAAAAFEHGAHDSAASRAADAQLAYREAERAATGTALLAEPRASVARARKAHANRNAPQTLEHAEALIAEAEEALAATPPDRERAQKAATTANAEALRAISLSTQLNDTTAESALRAWQDALAQVADSAEVALPSDARAADGAAAIVAAIGHTQAERARLEQDLADRNEQIRRLQGQNSSLTTELDGAARERIDLAQQLETQEAARARLISVENMFAPAQAEVLRERDDIVIRLFGLKFAPGSSKLGRDQQALLDHVIEAISLYSDRDVVVEGHTDAAGSPDANLELSRARARAVREYLIASGRVLAARVSSEGYGETRPVASNDTDEGRAHNRRIDVRLRPPQGGRQEGT